MSQRERLIEDLIQGINKMDEDEIVLTHRLIIQGIDPLAIVLANKGRRLRDVASRVEGGEAAVRRAHVEGPGFLPKGPLRDFWINLSALCADESLSATTSLADRVHEAAWAICDGANVPSGALSFEGEREAERFDLLPCQQLEGFNLLRMNWEDPDAASEAKGMVNEFFDLITSANGAPFIPLFESDRGFAAAYWKGYEVAAVVADPAVMLLGSQGRSLKEMGIRTDFVITDNGCLGGIEIEARGGWFNTPYRKLEARS